MSDIHFASLFCVDYDSDLASHWIRHYLDMGLDSYTLWLHSPRGDVEQLHLMHEFFRGLGVQVLIATGDFQDGKLRKEILGNYAESLDRRDFLVTADSDEFHEASLDTYCAHEITAGKTVDRFDSVLHAALPMRPIADQYPMEGDVEALVINSLPDAAKPYWPKINKNKICCARAGLPVAYGGSHMLTPELDGIKPNIDTSEPVKALHYCWRGTILERMAGKHYYDAAAVWYVWKFFGGVPGHEPAFLRDLIAKQEAAQTQKGWIPAYAGSIA